MFKNQWLSWFLTNDWFDWFWTTYSMLIASIPVIIAFLLKLIAIFHPDIKSDKIIELLQSFWPQKKI